MQFLIPETILAQLNRHFCSSAETIQPRRTKHSRTGSHRSISSQGFLWGLPEPTGVCLQSSDASQEFHLSYPLPQRGSQDTLLEHMEQTVLPSPFPQSLTSTSRALPRRLLKTPQEFISRHLAEAHGTDSPHLPIPTVSHFYLQGPPTQPTQNPSRVYLKTPHKNDSWLDFSKRCVSPIEQWDSIKLHLFLYTTWVWRKQTN